jgi:hypothetical protein
MSKTLYSTRQLATLLDISYARAWYLATTLCTPKAKIGERALYGEEAIDTMRLAVTTRKTYTFKEKV